MTTVIVAFVLSFLVSVVITRLSIPLAWKLGAVDRPDGYRKVHKNPTPRFGGPALFVAFLVPMAGLYFFPELSTISERMFDVEARSWGLVVGACLALALGVLDDFFNLRPAWKIVWQILIASVMYSFGYTIDIVSSPFGGEFGFGGFSYPVTVFWFVACMNAVNLLDGIDGLATGTCVFVGLTLFLVCMKFQNAFGMFLMACFSGAAMGFLVFNFPPARIFLGDSGSLLLGFLIAALSLVGAAMKTSTAVALFVPMVALGLPILDTSLAILRRWYRRLPLSAPDHEHIHHVLVTMGYSPRRAVLLLYAACLVLGGFALLVAIGQSEVILLVIGSLALMIVVSVKVFGRISIQDVVRKMSSDGARKDETARVRNTFEMAMAEIRNAGSIDEMWQQCGKVFAELGLDRAELEIACPSPGSPAKLKWQASIVTAPGESTADNLAMRLVLWHGNACVGWMKLEATRQVGTLPVDLPELVDRLRCAAGERTGEITKSGKA
ncbi:MAG: hypothetical protein C0404_08785 [Verrucomicrobia bacterium]|nr:hypothetical protein [Verrucomicrobiota bacterium]